MIKGALKAAVIITAAGTSHRMGTGTKKEFLKIDGKSVLLMSLEPFIELNLFSSYVIVLPKKEIEFGQEILSSLNESSGFIYVPGGNSRQESVYNGLKVLEKDAPDIVLIHDGARPWITEAVINEVFLKAIQTGSAVPVVSSVNAMKTINSQGTIVANLKREFTVAAQTPQGFNFLKILSSHEKAHLDKSEYIDDAEIYGKYIGDVATVDGDTANRKITFLSDMKGFK